MLARRVSKGVLSVGAWTVTKVLASALATPLISRGLGTDGYGLFAYYFALMMIAAPLASGGVLQMMAMLISENPDSARRSRVATVAALLAGGTSLATGAVLGAIFLSESPVANPTLFAAMLLASILFDVVWFYARGILYGLQREELAGVPGSAAAVIGSATSVALVLAGLGLMGALAGVLVGNMIMALTALRSALRLCPPAPLRHAVVSDDPRPRTMVRIALTTMLSMTAAMVLYKTSVVLVRHLTGSDALTGLFATALQMAEFVWVLVIAVEGVMLQSTARMWREGQTDGITTLVSRAVRYTSLMAVFCLTYVFVFAEEAISLYFGARFAGAAPVLRILVPGVLSYSLARLLGPVLYARGDILVMTAVVFSATVLAVALNLLLVPVWGIAGAGVATACAYGIVLVPYVLLLRGHGVHPFAGFQSMRQMLLLLGTGAAMVALREGVEGNLARLFTGGVVGFVLFTFGALRLRLVRIEEIEEVVRSLPGRISELGLRSLAALRPVLTIIGIRPERAGGV